jgi:hypothetical protein
MSAGRAPGAAAAACALVVLFGAARPASAFSYRCPDSAYQVNLAVVFANGMSNHIDDAQASRDTLRRLLAPRLELDPHAITFDIAYNHSENALEQLWQVAKQRAPMSVSLFVRILNGLVPAPDWFNDELKRLAAAIDLQAFAGDADLAAQVQIYRDHLRKGRKVVVVAHSQGNLYANAAYRSLFESAQPTPGERDFGIVGVALPAPTVAGWSPPECEPLGCYTTLETDLIVQSVVAAMRAAVDYSDTAPPNVFALPTAADPLSHGFRETYLGLEAPRKQILDDVARFVSAFDPLEVTIPDAMITASLEWDTSADLDLHVYENGATEHVYYAYPDGEGHLDADATGYGPENYSAKCGAVKAGDFRFAVGYVGGPGPVRARLRVQAGGTTRTFEKTLTAAQGHAANTQPETFAWLHIAQQPKQDGRSYELLLVADE